MRYLFITSDGPAYSPVSVLSPLGSSDHNLISFRHSCHRVDRCRVKRRVWEYGRANWSNMRDFFAGFDWQNYVFSKSDVCYQGGRFLDVLEMAMELFIPFKDVSPRKIKKWFDKKCNYFVAQKQRLFNAFKKILIDQIGLLISMLVMNVLKY